jgi:hypothetical protein
MAEKSSAWRWLGAAFSINKHPVKRSGRAFYLVKKRKESQLCGNI